MELKLLIVDNDKDRSACVVQKFETEELRIICCDNVYDALKVFRTRSPAVVTISNDLLNAEQIGFPILASIRLANNTRLLALIPSSYDAPVRAKMRNDGADILMTLPPDHEEFTAAIKTLLRQWKGCNKVLEPGGYVMLGDLRIDRPHRKVLVGDRNVVLTGKEFDILYMLACNPGTVFSKDEIYERVWKEDSLYGSRSVTDHIASIRAKLDPRPDGQSFIRTMHAVGYCFRD